MRSGASVLVRHAWISGDDACAGTCSRDQGTTTMPETSPTIEGDLNSADLASVVQMLVSGGREGILAVDSGEQDGRRKLVLFGPVGITLLLPQERLDLAISQALLRGRRV